MREEDSLNHRTEVVERLRKRLQEVRDGNVRLVPQEDVVDELG